MTLRLTVKLRDTDAAIPGEKELAEAAAYGMEVCVRRHLREKNRRTAPNRNGLPKSNYYAEAADTVRGAAAGKTAVVEAGPETDDPSAPGSGIALHYHGGTVYPKKRALAIPVNAAVAGIWPSEANAVSSNTAILWPKNSDHGFIKDTETGELLWLLIPKATIPADPTVMPTEDEIAGAAERALLPLLEAAS